MTAPRRGPTLVTHPGGGYSWAWPDDPANVAEDERIAAVYHAERLKRDAAYAAKRAEYLKAVEAGEYFDVVLNCPVCGDPAYGGDTYCSDACLNDALAIRRVTVKHARGGITQIVTRCHVCRRVIPESTAGKVRLYCSRQCRKTAQTRRFRQKRKIA